MFNRFFLFLLLFALTNVLRAQDSLEVVVEPYPLTGIADAHEKSMKELGGIESFISNKKDIDAIRTTYHQLLEESLELKADTIDSSSIELGLFEIKNIYGDWNRYLLKIKNIEAELQAINLTLVDHKQVLSDYKERWSKTLEVAQNENATEVVELRITDYIDQIDKWMILLKEKEDAGFVLLDSVSDEHAFVIRTTELITAMEKLLKANIFSKDSPPFFDMSVDSLDSLSSSTTFIMAFQKSNKVSAKYLRNNEVIFYVHLMLTLAFFFLFFFVNREIKTIVFEDSTSYLLFRRFVSLPLVSTIIFGLFITFFIYEGRPVALSETALLIMIFPLVYALIGVFKSNARLALIAAAFLYFLDKCAGFLVNDINIQREVYMLEALIGILVSFYLSLPRTGYISNPSQKIWWAAKLFPIVPVLFAWAIYLNLVGNFQLSMLVTSGLVRLATIGFVLYTVVRFLEGLVETIILSRIGHEVHTIEFMASGIRSWSRIIFRAYAIYLWVMACLNHFRWDQGFNDWWEALMDTGWDFGEVTLSIGLLVNFILIIVIFSVIANVSRHLLEFEILPRFKPKKGIPMAVGVVTRYFILVLGFFMAVAAAGISLDKLGFIAGALGVGIGFGLQNVVNNFVSGLILVFERPVHIDDVVTAGEIEGIVKDIGIRSSKIRTWEGAEVIVPNSDLVSFKVTNWTLSDTKRRREHIIKVESGSDPNEVIEILSEVLAKNEDVLEDPSPMVLFIGQSSYSFDFRVLYWISARLLLADSEVALDLYNALKNKGIQIAMPKQYMLSKDGTVTSKLKAAPKRRTAKPKENDSPSSTNETKKS